MKDGRGLRGGGLEGGGRGYRGREGVSCLLSQGHALSLFSREAKPGRSHRKVRTKEVNRAGGEEGEGVGVRRGWMGGWEEGEGGGGEEGLVVGWEEGEGGGGEEGWMGG